MIHWYWLIPTFVLGMFAGYAVPLLLIVHDFLGGLHG